MTGSNDVAQVLNDYLQRIEALEEQIRLAKEQIADIYADVKIDGFDVKAVKQMVKSRLIERVKEIEPNDLYESATKGEA